MGLNASLVGWVGNWYVGYWWVGYWCGVLVGEILVGEVLVGGAMAAPLLTHLNVAAAADLWTRTGLCVFVRWYVCVCVCGGGGERVVVLGD